MRTRSGSWVRHQVTLSPLFTGCRATVTVALESDKRGLKHLRRKAEVRGPGAERALDGSDRTCIAAGQADASRRQTVVVPFEENEVFFIVDDTSQ
jgi:hypothetical protein